MPCDSPHWVLPKAAFEKVPVPCGRCPPCKLRRVNSWVFRLLEEDKVSLSSHFITLTYDTRYVPISENGFMTLQKKDFQDYMKRLRKLCPDSTLKYYACGEYGSKNRRPHYHAIVFNCPDAELFARAWTIDGNQLGTVHVGTVTGDSVAYTMKYIDKPSHGRQHARDDRQSEFPLMSKGLGSSYLSKAVIDYHLADISRLHVTKPGGHLIALPKYYRTKIYSDAQLKLQLPVIKSAMQEREQKNYMDYESMYGDTDYTYEAYVDSQRFGRYKSFNTNQQNRDI